MYPWSGKNIYFLGFMAVGKTKIGSSFAHFLGWPFHDTDDLVQARAGKSISDIFLQDGEDEFRRLETEVIRDLADKQNNIIALGGGAVLRDENWKLLQCGITICLAASVDILDERIARRDHRPIMAGLSPQVRREKIERLLAEREPYYHRADFTFQEEMPPRDYVNFIFETLLEKL